MYLFVLNGDRLDVTFCRGLAFSCHRLRLNWQVNPTGFVASRQQGKYGYCSFDNRKTATTLYAIGQ